MKHKKQLRKTQDDQKNPNDLHRSLESENESSEKKMEEVKTAMNQDSYMLEENEDDVDIEDDDICSPEQLL